MGRPPVNPISIFDFSAPEVPDLAGALTLTRVNLREYVSFDTLPSKVWHIIYIRIEHGFLIKPPAAIVKSHKEIGKGAPNIDWTIHSDKWRQYNIKITVTYVPKRN